VTTADSKDGRAAGDGNSRPRPSRLAAAEVRAAILRGLAGPLSAVGLVADDVPDDLDLLQRGVVDSLGLVSLLADIEAQFGIELDYDDLPVEDLARVGPLSRHVERQSARA